AYVAVFFFSSRRRHTRSKRDWSSDVCSSDLSGGAPESTPTIAPVISSASPTRPAATNTAHNAVMPSAYGSTGMMAPEAKKQKLEMAACQGEPISSRLRSEEHTSELQSRFDIACRLLLE